MDYNVPQILYYLQSFIFLFLDWLVVFYGISTIVDYLMPKSSLYTYIKYYIITVLFVTKSLCGFVSNQVQYNMEGAFILSLTPTYTHINTQL